MPPRFSIGNILSSPAGEEFLRGFQTHDFAKGALISDGGGGENGVFVITSGRLRVFMVGEEQEISLFYLDVGDMFSMHSGCMIEACEPSELKITDIATFHRKMAVHPEVALSLVSILGRAMASCIRTIQDLAFHDVRQRLVRFFLDHAASSGRGGKAGIEIALPMTVEEIARLIGSGRQATSTAIGGLLRDGLVGRVKRGHYVIPDPERLQGEILPAWRDPGPTRPLKR